MLGLTSKKLLQPNRFRGLIPSFLFSSKSTPGSEFVTRRKDLTFTVSYLTEACGLSPEAAKCIHLGFSGTQLASGLGKNSKDVIMNFKKFGFHDYLITKLVLKKPNFLLSDGAMKDEVEVLACLGVQPSIAAEILLKFPDGHLQDMFVPFVDFLKSLCFGDEEVVEMVRNLCCHDRFDPEAFLGNMSILRGVGMTDSIVSRFVRMYDQKLMLFMLNDLFKKVVDEVKGMGLSPKNIVFVDAMIAISVVGVEVYRWKSKVFKKWGWSDAELLKAFIDKPQLLGHAEKKVDEVMECLVKILGFNYLVVVQCPLALTCSKKKLISRFSVAKFLWERGVIDADSYKMSSFLSTDEDWFMKKFVTKHMEIVPELLNLYLQCKRDGKPFYAGDDA